MSIKTITIEELLTLSQEDLFEYLLENVPNAEDVNGNIIVNNPLPEGVTHRPMLMAHLDTVSYVQPKLSEIRRKRGTLSLKQKKKKISYVFKNRFKKDWQTIGGPTCLGADDRAGVWLMLQILQSHPNKYTFAWFEKEERGCIGSTVFTQTELFEELDAMTSVFIGLDRRCDEYNPEIAQYGYDNEDLDIVLEDQLPEFEFTSGSFTDCSTLAFYSFLKTPCINLSVGYRNEHSVDETLHIPSMLMTLEALKHLQIPDMKYKATSPPVYNRTSYSHVGSGHDGVITCDLCGIHEPLYEDFYTFNQVCGDCLEQSYTTKREGNYESLS